MALDGIIISKIKLDFEKELPIKINKIFESSKTEIIFNIYSKNNKNSIVVSLHPNYNRLSFTEKTYTDFNEPSTFVMVLRKYLTNGVIESIEQKNYDRYLLFHISSFNNLYDKVEYILSIELMGKYTNMILVNKKTNKIIDAYKKIAPYENSKRTILINASFEPIESQNKKDPFIDFDYDINKSFVEQYQGFSKLLENEIRYRLDKENFETIMNEIKNSNNIYLTENEYHVIPLKHLKQESSCFSLTNAFDNIYYQKSENERIKNCTNDISKFVNKEIKHYSNKLKKLESSLLDSKNYMVDKEIGDMLFMQNDLTLKGLSSIDLFINEHNNKVILDPKISIKDNANKYYKAYSKKKKSINYISEEITKCSNELEYFNALSEQLEVASYQDGLEIKNELIKYNYIKPDKTTNNKKHKTKLKQIIVDSYKITWGSNNIENDFLTFNYANRNSTFFHAQKFHGSHVIVDSNQLNEKIIRIAANIAAYYSKGRFSSSVPVDYCSIKDVKKIKGKKAGFVSIKNQKTIYIDPEEINLHITII